MARYSSKSLDEVPSKDADAAKRRTKPEDHRPYSPKAIDAIYRKGKTITRPRDPEHQPPQFPEDQHAKGYDNDVPLKGERSWLRGGGRGGEDRPTFDRGHFDNNSKPPKPASGLKASGQDCSKSPFSAAYRKGSGEGF